MRRWVKISVLTVFCAWLSCSAFEHWLLFSYKEDLHQFFFPEIYEGEFPEYKFPCSKKRKIEYSHLVNAGYANMKQSRVVICGLARNCATSLECIERRVEETGSLFKDYRVVLFENDSKDTTRLVLKQWQKRNSKVHLIECKIPDCKFGSPTAYVEGGCSPNRFERMANFRNQYLAYVNRHYKKFDYLIVVDMDLKGPWSLDGLASSFGFSNWDGIFACGLHTTPLTCGLLYNMYDMAAYVKKGDPTDRLISATDVGKNYLQLNFWDYLFVKKGDPLFPVSSAFGGMAIYKIKSLQGSWYDGRTCEHVSLHNVMSEKGHGEFYINPSLILLSGSQGPPPENFQALFQK